MILLTERPEWHRRAACRTVHPNVMFPVNGAGVAIAQQYCARCPVRSECADAGLLEANGVWGGQSERTRARLRKLAGLRAYSTSDQLDDEDLDQEDTAS